MLGLIMVLTSACFSTLWRVLLITDLLLLILFPLFPCFTIALSKEGHWVKPNLSVVELKTEKRSVTMCVTFSSITIPVAALDHKAEINSVLD